MLDDDLGQHFPRQPQRIWRHSAKEAAKAVAISTLKVGDEVRSADPKTGKKTTRKVTKVHRNHDTDLLDVNVVRNGHRTVLRTTATHPFWSQTRHAWVRADQLATTDRLQSTKSGAVRTAAIAVIPGDEDRWDLTVDIDHDYDVMAGGTAVLAHNCGTAAKSADDWPLISGILRDASKGKGDFGLGSGTASQAERAGQSWVGEGAQ